MLYRKLGNTNIEVSVLGFGCMRLPVIDDKVDKINKKLAYEMLDYAISKGVNYLDTAYPYHSQKFDDKGGMSEPFIGEYIKEKNNREDLILATKSPIWFIKNPKDFDLFLDKQLERLGTDYLDVYLIHSIREEHWDNLLKSDMFDFLDRIKDDGRVKHVGFSYHDNEEFFYKVVDSYNWEVVQTQLNYLDENYQSGLNGVRYVDNKTMGNIIMEPLHGGRLAENVPSALGDIWSKSDNDWSDVEWAFKYLYNMPEVDVVLSGMSNMEQVVEDVKIAESGFMNSLSLEDKALIDEAKHLYESRKGNDCTTCGYCMPCVNDVDIPACFNEYNVTKMLDVKDNINFQYMTFIPEDNRASNCINCGDCVSLCPQNIDIPAELKKVEELYEK